MWRFIKFVFSFKDQKKQLLGILLAAFLISFYIARSYAVLTGRSVYIEGYQIHHFYFGMLSLSIGGVLALLSKGRKASQVASAIMGMGIGLFADEIGLLLNCTTANHPCAYAFPDYLDIIGVIALIIFLLALILDALDQYRARARD